MKEQTEKVSILIPIFNAEENLNEAIESIQEQSYQNIEIICVNDGSTDNSKKIIDEIRARDKRIKIINKEHSGLIDTLNIGIENCTGKYIARMDADDISFKDRIKKQVKLMEINSNIVASGTGIILFNKNGELKKSTKPI